MQRQNQLKPKLHTDNKLPVLAAADPCVFECVGMNENINDCISSVYSTSSSQMHVLWVGFK